VILSAEQSVKVQYLLGSAAAQTRLEKYEDAANNYEQVLRDFDCSNEEARRGLKATDPGNDKRYENAIAKCPGSN
jgi:hypothetical protein